MMDPVLPGLASGDAATRTSILKILLGIGDPAGVIKRYIRFSSSLAGFVRDRTLESLREFGSALVEPVIELLHDADPDTRSGAMAVAGVFEDVRIVPATIELLRDAGLAAVNRMAPVKRLLMRHAMGAAGPRPRLLRGLPL